MVLSYDSNRGGQAPRTTDAYRWVVNDVGRRTDGLCARAGHPALSGRAAGRCPARRRGGGGRGAEVECAPGAGRPGDQWVRPPGRRRRLPPRLRPAAARVRLPRESAVQPHRRARPAPVGRRHRGDHPLRRAGRRRHRLPGEGLADPQDLPDELGDRRGQPGVPDGPGQGPADASPARPRRGAGLRDPARAAAGQDGPHPHHRRAARRRVPGGSRAGLRHGPAGERSRDRLHRLPLVPRLSEHPGRRAQHQRGVQPHVAGGADRAGRPGPRDRERGAGGAGADAGADPADGTATPTAPWTQAQRGAR